MADDNEERPRLAITRLAEGQAALWLGESLILALIDADILDKERILEVLDVVIAAKRTMAAEGRDSDIEQASAGLLAAISASIGAMRNEASGGSNLPARRRRTRRS
jgi:hypothetical protein